MNTELMDQVERTDGRLEKEKLLRTADERTKQALKYATDTFITFGATVDTAAASTMVEADAELSAMDARLFGQRATTKSKTQTPASAAWWARGFALFDRLAQRTLSGNAAQTGIYAWLADVPSMADAKWAIRVLNKDLRCGVSQKTIVKVFPGLIEPFAVALARPYDGQELGAGFIEPKLDGLRMTIIDGEAFTRNGHKLEGMEHVIEPLGDLAHKWVWDGECLDPNVSFEETSGALRKHGGDKRSQIFHAFDVVERGEWSSRDTASTLQRKRDLNALRDRVKGKTGAITFIMGQYVDGANMDQLLQARDRYIANGLEGAMFKLADAPYLFKRSDAVLKFKRFDTMDVKIVDVTEGTGKYEGMLGALVVEIDGVRFNVGSGYVDMERNTFWGMRETLIGKTVEVKFQNKTQKGKARFPIFVRLRPDKDAP